MTVYANPSKDSRSELRIVALVLLAYALYALAAGMYSIVDAHLVPRWFVEPSRPQRVMPWFYALITVLGTALTVTVAGLSHVWVKAGQPRGWWLSGTLFAHMLISGCLGMAQMILMRIPPQNLPRYTANTELLTRTGIVMALAAGMLVYLCRTSVMRAISIEPEGKASKIGRLFLFGLLLTLLNIVLIMMASSMIVISMR